MMKTILYITINILMLLAWSYSQSLAQENKIIGDWLTTEKDAIVTMYYGKSSGEDPSKIYGKLSWMEEPNEEDGSPKLDKENPEEDLRNRKLLGMTIIKDLEWDGDEDDWEWEDGSAYDPESGNTYSFQVEIEPEAPNILNCRGYLGISLLGRTEVWTRKK